jgi:hypothetical protein
MANGAIPPGEWSLTPRDFGVFGNSLLEGNFKSGWIAAFNGFTHKFIGFVKNPGDNLLTIDGLWRLPLEMARMQALPQRCISLRVRTVRHTVFSGPWPLWQAKMSGPWSKPKFLPKTAGRNSHPYRFSV